MAHLFAKPYVYAIFAGHFTVLKRVTNFTRDSIEVKITAKYKSKSLQIIFSLSLLVGIQEY